jgi:hypothetical protein
VKKRNQVKTFDTRKGIEKVEGEKEKKYVVLSLSVS